MIGSQRVPGTFISEAEKVEKGGKRWKKVEKRWIIEMFGSTFISEAEKVEKDELLKVWLPERALGPL